MGRKTENTGFICANCRAEVLPLSGGSYRNHCPFCLHSLHVDEEIGDRKSECLGVMEPASVKYNTQKGWQILHRCLKCGFERYNIINDDDVQPDNMELVAEIMRTKGMYDTL